ncbi:hypothetical protein ES332_D03G125100v1 [Gossypium tomentosum]|uniref:Uncharacterized protein n=1 Tax=Gossypium tomentosum TaxID=34277 RepID=A0A5D2LLJ1_GOSTO|nr:hypothetical protein ES332_D03G125100v1 [Gossypium tomentosum]TYH80334.1 hypothetical protein ES332_D03G125100v1 [Gossypium tomentosum]TYH80335.1 hypothetical protein ES332_D03G125100v1 [Gossypium tomentosum]TYH80336.1 hypothetical protein ES332_D03G125100v1 [Gossypium tomentosum]TYH80337.1 hypothetical protein ES332_D03G125100v1 [Gossypium tomentosum]
MYYFLIQWVHHRIIVWLVVISYYNPIPYDFIQDMFGWGKPYFAGPPPNRRLVGCNVITARISSVRITPIGCNSHSPIQRRLGIPYPFLIFYSIFCPHRFLLLLPSILQRLLPSLF